VVEGFGVEDGWAEEKSKECTSLHGMHLSCQPEPQRDASLRLSMTALSRMLLPAGVTLSRSEGSVSMGSEMLRCGSA